MRTFLLIVLISEVSVTPTKIRYIQALGGVWNIKITFFTCSVEKGMLRFCHICEQARAANVKWIFPDVKISTFYYEIETALDSVN